MNKRLLLIVCGILWFLPGKAQEAVDSMRIYYVVGHREVDPSFRNNRVELNRFMKAVRSLMQENAVERIIIRSGASPDGYDRANELLSERRADSLAAYIVRHTSVPADLIEKQGVGIAWDMLRRQVDTSDMRYREEVLHVLDNTPVFVFDARGRVVDGRKKRLMDLYGGRPYKYMLKVFFPDLRSSIGVTLYTTKQVAPVADTVTVADSLAESLPDTLSVVEPVAEQPTVGLVAESAGDLEPMPSEAPAVTENPVPSVEEWGPKLSVKTNAIGWGMLMINAAVEVDLSRRFSLNIPLYYSACNYFTNDIKFLMLAFQPELRVWPLAKRRFFAGVHFGVTSYNLALGGKWRIQDHNGDTPAWGGGVNVGYRLPLSRNERWNVEFSLGAGVYKLHYDKFRNEYNGAYDSSVKKTFFGIDNVAVSFSYMFDLKNKRR